MLSGDFSDNLDLKLDLSPLILLLDCVLDMRLMTLPLLSVKGAAGLSNKRSWFG